MKHWVIIVNPIVKTSTLSLIGSLVSFLFRLLGILQCLLRTV